MGLTEQTQKSHSKKGLIVQKFGGTSVGSIERVKNVAQRVLAASAQGHPVVVVVSAMAGETNRLVSLAHEINPIPDSAEFDLLISSGEQVAVGLLTLAINSLARQSQSELPKARAFLAHQLGILTDRVYSKARIQAIDTGLLNRALANGQIPVVAGFQGVDPEHNITTLGRGGSDTSAVALAAALGAERCDIFTDVDGVYTTDPRLCPEAVKMKSVSYEEMMELAGLGAKVLQIRSVELAAKYKVPVRVLSSFLPETETSGTWVLPESESSMEQVKVAGVAADVNQVKLTVENIPDVPGVAAKIFGNLSEAGIVVDVIVQNQVADGKIALAFTVPQSDRLMAIQILEKLKKDSFPTTEIQSDSDLAKVSIVGAGMRHHPGVAAQMFQILADHGIGIRLISTSEIKVSCLIPRADAEKAVRALHQGFELDRMA